MVAQPGAAQAHAVQAADGAHGVGGAEGGHVLGLAHEPAYHGQAADAGELMDRGAAAEQRFVPDAHVPAEERVVGEGDVVAHGAVVAHVGVGHQVVAVAETSGGVAARGVDRHALAQHVTVTDRDARLERRDRVPARLGAEAEAAERKQVVVRADRHGSANVHVGLEPGPRPDPSRARHHAAGPDHRVVRDVHRVIDNRARIDHEKAILKLPPGRTAASGLTPCA